MKHHDEDTRIVEPAGNRSTGTEIRTTDMGRDEARRRFGGLDVPASLVGMLTALAMVVLLGGVLAAAIGAVGYQAGLTTDDTDELGVSGLVGGLVTLFVAFLVGGWAAARMARYDGVRNGAMTVVWTILLSAIFAGIGAVVGSQYDVFDRVDLPRWLLRDDVGIAGILSAVAAIAVMFLGAMLGGWWGARYHRRADAAIVGAETDRSSI